MDAKVSTKTKTKTFQNHNKNCPIVEEMPFGRKAQFMLVLKGYNFAVPLTFMILIESFVDPQEHATGNSAMKKP